MGLGGIVKRIFKAIKLKKRVFDPEKIDVEDIKLPKIIDNLDNAIISNMVKEEVATYRSLGYKSKSDETLNQKVYHSFQIGVMLRYLQLQQDILITDDIFPNKIKQLSKVTLQLKVFNIIAIYDKTINKDFTAVQLVNDLEWTPIDAGYILHYLSVYID